jgi:glycosyltransferase involved in cell wall biosynthesis
VSIILISFTALDAGGGVPRWNRDFIKGFPEARHYSWDDYQRAFPGHGNDLPEWNRARVLNDWLIRTNKITKEDLIIVDGFWGLGIPRFFNVISVAHGIWSHLTTEDVLAGKKPEFPVHHREQVLYRRDLLNSDGTIVAVSGFIEEQMRMQWGFRSTVVNNAVNLSAYRPVPHRRRDRPLIIHGVTTANKGLDHIEFMKKNMPDVDILLLDEAAKMLDCSTNIALAHADLVVQPSAYEGNSYFVLETLACNVPIVAYNVGLLHSVNDPIIGTVLSRRNRSPEETYGAARVTLNRVLRNPAQFNPRKIAEHYSLTKFHEEWRKVISDVSNSARR